MAAFASCRRSGWVRLLVVILCALFILATLAVPPAQALGVESVAVFGLASVLSAATAALGFKLSSNEQGQATLQKMVQDFKTVAWATGFVLVGSKLNGLQNGMDYIKMQVQNGKTYLDSRIFAWVQQWLAQNGVYDSGTLTPDISSVNSLIGKDLSSVIPDTEINLDAPTISYDSFMNYFGLSSLPVSESFYNKTKCFLGLREIGKNQYVFCCSGSWLRLTSSVYNYDGINREWLTFSVGSRLGYVTNDSGKTWRSNSNYQPLLYPLDDSGIIYGLSNWLLYSTLSNSTGLSGTDTLGKDVVDLTLDQVLEQLKEWAPDWFDAGADSATNSATGALDLPLTVATGAATANPSIAEDGPLVWFPPFSVPIPNLRTGETDTNTVDQGKENASTAETSTVDVAENQTVIDSLVNWALSYISPDTGLFSKFPLCVPYDAYLLVTSSLGVDAVGSDSIFGASPGDLEGVVSQDIETYSDFEPIINIKHDFQLDGATYPIELTIDLTPWQPLVTFFREGMALLLVAELIGAEFKRIRGH